MIRSSPNGATRSHNRPKPVQTLGSSMWRGELETCAGQPRCVAIELWRWHRCPRESASGVSGCCVLRRPCGAHSCVCLSQYAVHVPSTLYQPARWWLYSSFHTWSGRRPISRNNPTSGPWCSVGASAPHNGRMRLVSAALSPFLHCRFWTHGVGRHTSMSGRCAPSRAAATSSRRTIPGGILFTSRLPPHLAAIGAM